METGKLARIRPSRHALADYRRYARTSHRTAFYHAWYRHCNGGRARIKVLTRPISIAPDVETQIDSFKNGMIVSLNTASYSKKLYNILIKFIYLN